MTNLLNCPCCGGKAILTPPDGMLSWGAECSNPSCQLQGRMSGDRDKAIAAWNRRTPIDHDQIMRDNITTHNDPLRSEHKGKCTVKCYMSPHMSMGMHKTNCYLAGLEIEEEFCMVCVGSGRSDMLGHSECGYCKGKGYTTEEDTGHLLTQVGAKDRQREKGDE